MRHRVAHRKLGRVTEHRIAMLRNQASALIEHERIETTVARGKELRPFVERIITIAKRSLERAGGQHARRDRAAHGRARHRGPRGRARSCSTTIAPRYAERPGGYTRMLRLGHRRGDSADVAAGRAARQRVRSERAETGREGGEGDARQAEEEDDGRADPRGAHRRPQEGRAGPRRRQGRQAGQGRAEEEHHAAQGRRQLSRIQRERPEHARAAELSDDSPAVAAPSRTPAPAWRRTCTTRRSSTSRMLSERTGFDVRLKAELFQRTGSYKIRGPLNKFTFLTDEQKRARRDLLVGRQPRAGRGARREDPRHPGRRLHGGERDAVEDRGDARLRRRGRAARHDLGRGEREGEAARRRARLHLHPSVRRRAADHGAGDGRPRDRPATGPTSTSSSCRSAAAG